MALNRPPVANDDAFTVAAASVANLSVSYRWLVVADERARFEGTGRVDGEGGYGFSLTAVDGKLQGGSDALRMRIWSEATGDVLYDSQPGNPHDADPTTALGGGSIVLH